MTPAIRLENLRKNYQLAGETLQVLKGINLVVPEGDYIAIMGPSGSGKSTLLNILGCLDQPSSGAFYLGEDDVATLGDDRLAFIRSSRIGFVFQSYNLIPQLTVVENIEAPLAYQGEVTEEGHQRAIDLATLVGLSQRLTHRPLQLSGGQQQRAGIARGLVNQPRYILADEPTGNLDSATTKEILDLLERLNESGKTIILVTHEEEVAYHARRIVRLRDGLIQSDTRLREVSPPSRSQDPHDSTALPEARSTPSRASSTHESSLSSILRTAYLGTKNLLLHPLRSLLTILGIFIGVASVVWLLAIGEGISAKAQEQIAELGANNIILTSTAPTPQRGAGRSRGSFGITVNDYEQIAATIPTISKVIPMREFARGNFGYGTNLCYGRLVGCTPEHLALSKLLLTRGHFVTATDVKEHHKVCVLSAQIALELFGYEDPVGKAIHIGSDFYSVIGITGPKEDSSPNPKTSSKESFDRDVFIPISTMWSRISDFYAHTESGVPIASQVTLSVNNPKDVLDTAEIIRQMLKRTHSRDDYTITVPMELLEQAKNTRLMFIAMMGLVAAISLIVGGIGIMNIMLATVTERTREIGIRRAIGARCADITRQFLVETVVLSVAGGITGAIGGLMCKPVFWLAMKLFTRLFPKSAASLPDVVRTMTPIIVPWSLPLAFGISVAIGVVFGLYPARRASRMNPIEALRHVT
jgi:ABC-type lipoprotein export system ATPase subunit/ABC-type antimicrobial peptide transport system permease subunit